MRIDFNRELKTLDGRILKDVIDGEERNAILKMVCINALLANSEDDKKIDGEEKLKRYELAKKIAGANEPLKLRSEEVALIKKLVGKVFGTLIVGQTFQMLEDSIPDK